eukprot:c14590_g1_i1.p1 GENE.c14590_g1_i1~~c14590_g1_i1.p1  ORF type:complete len:217 (+),score=30.25 c14590_g1_i1:43-651(+)
MSNLDALVLTLLADGRYQEILAACEQDELHSQLLSVGSEPTPRHRCIHLLTYLIVNDITNARHLWRRLRTDLQNHPEIQATWDVTKRLAAKDDQAAHSILVAFNWPDGVRPFVSSLADAIRKRTFQYLAEAHTSVSLDELHSRLGLTESQAIDLALKFGWDYDEAHRSLSPAVHDQPIADEKFQADLRKLADIALFLEKDSN